MMKLPKCKRLLLGSLASGLLVLGLWPKAHAASYIFTADDLRGTWMFELLRTTGTSPMNPNGTFYLKVGLGGTSTNGNLTVQVLAGGTTQETPERTVTGGTMSITAAGSINGVVTLNDTLAQGSTITFAASGVNTTTTGNVLLRGLQDNLLSIPNQRDMTITANLPVGLGIAATDTGAAGITTYWSAQKISNSENDATGGGNSGMCFLTAARRR